MAAADRVIHGDKLERDQGVEGDVVVIGTGAGGGVTAEILAKAGLKVVLVEEGGYYTARDFHMLEAQAYRSLYYDAGARQTKDKGIRILQGRAVGGSTTVNWTTCLRAPADTLAYWTRTYGVKGFSVDAMAPWFARMEKQLSISLWPARNPNNDVLFRGANKLGWHAEGIPRNVKACRNTGYCGMGCPVDAKQSMLVTTVPSALDRGAVLIVRTRAQSLEIKGDRVVAVNAVALNAKSVDPTGIIVRIEAPHVVLAGGSINNPALLLRSKAPDPYARAGKRTFLHVVNASTAIMPETVNPFDGAPQSAYSNQFLYRDGVTGKLGYKLETAPQHPMQVASATLSFGRTHSRLIAELPHISTMIALMRDGFHEDSQGGTVTIANDGSPVIDYPISPYVWEGLRHAYLSMAECQFAAGANQVIPVHMDAVPYDSWSKARAAIEELPLRVLHAQLFSAHVMGGCAMGEDPRRSVVDSWGQHRHLANLWIIDGSVFPTSVGANPSLSIYAMAARNATALAEVARGNRAMAYA